MAEYNAHYIHQVSPSPDDTEGPYQIRDGAFADSQTLGKALREAGVLTKGATVRHFRVEGDKIVVFPSLAGSTTYWHAIVIEPSYLYQPHKAHVAKKRGKR